MRKRIKTIISAAAFLTVLVLGSWIVLSGGDAYSAQDIVVAQADITDAPPPGGNGHHGPPPEAIGACEGFSDGDSCSFTSRRGDEIVGTCGTTRKGDFACIPEGGPPGKGGRTPDDMPPPPSGEGE